MEGFTIEGDGQEDVDGIRAEGVRDFQIVRNYLQGHSWSGIAGIRSSLQVIGNVIVRDRVAGVFLDGQSSEPSRVEHNTICGNRNEAGVNVWREAAALVYHNIIVGNTGSGGICAGSDSPPNRSSFRPSRGGNSQAAGTSFLFSSAPRT